METNLLTKILLIVFVLHLVVGFGYMIYRLSPRKSDKEIENADDNDE